MQKHVMLVVAWMIVAVPAIAAPSSLTKGHWSLGFEADRDVNVNVGYGLADMTRLIVNGAMVSPGDVEVESRQIEVTTSYSVGIGLQRYLGWASNEQFAAFLGGGVAYTASAERTEEVQLGDPPGGTLQLRFNPGDVYSIHGRFGMEFFPWDPISVSGHIGVAADMHGDGESVGLFSPQQPVDAGNDVSTFSSLFVTFYWEGISRLSPQAATPSFFPTFWNASSARSWWGSDAIDERTPSALVASSDFTEQLEISLVARPAERALVADQRFAADDRALDSAKQSGNTIPPCGREVEPGECSQDVDPPWCDADLVDHAGASEISGAQIFDGSPEGG